MNFKLAFRNVLRHRTRSLISMIAITSSVISLILAGGFIEDTVTQVREYYINQFLGHLRIYKPGFQKHGLLHPFDYMISEPEKIIQDIDAMPHVHYTAPRLSFGGLLSTGDATLSVIAEGTDPRIESPGKSKAVVETGTALTLNDGYDILLGKGLSAATESHLGDSLVLVTNTQRGAMNALDLKVRGVLAPINKPFDDHVVRIPLGTAQKLLRTKDVQSLMIYLDSTDYTDAVQLNIANYFKNLGLNYEVEPWYKLDEADYVLILIAFYRRIFLVLTIIIVAVVTLGIANTTNMAVLERIGEIGTLMAMGTKRKQIVSLFLAEGLCLGMAGGIVGIVVGTVLAKIISQIGIPMPAPGWTVSWTAQIAIVPKILLLSFGLALFTALLSTILPALKASRLEIAESLRRNI